jgi:hypothetical protein
LTLPDNSVPIKILITGETDMPSDDARRGKFLSHEISDRQTTQLIGLAQGVIADGRLDPLPAQMAGGQ